MYLQSDSTMSELSPCSKFLFAAAGYKMVKLVVEYKLKDHHLHTLTH